LKGRVCGNSSDVATSSNQPSGAAHADRVDRLLRAVAAIALDQRDELDRLDAAAADGDFGSTFARGAAALAADPPEGDAVAVLRRASEQVTDAMGGSSGPLCGVALLRAAEAVEEDGDADPAALVRAAIAGIQDFGGAERGDKTALDALFPVAEALEADSSTAEAAREAADATAESQARKGRAAYAGERSSGSPDPGAVAVALVAEALERDEVPEWSDLAGRGAGGGTGEEEGEDAPRSGFVADPSDFVHEALEGFVRANAGVRRVDGSQVIVRSEPAADGRVAVVSGGGAGHEPLHAGFVGEGMLDAAVPGAVFTSPAPKEVLTATTEVAAGAGVLYIVKSYTGDILNFRLAGEFAAAEDIETETVVVADDVAIDADSSTERRGTGVTIAVEKVAGALAAEGAKLADVADAARRVVERGRSFGVALHGDEMELGVGIHGEPGRDPTGLESADAIATALIDPVLAEVPAGEGDPVLVLLSGLGGTPSLELHVLFEHVGRQLEERGLVVARVLVGDLITSLGQPGAVLSVVALDDELTRLWDAPVHTPALRW
jgi:phosphoenolpyruvate---glycerone phosphotransferase subunit DhaK